ncbi:MAG: hypothetical protein RLZZ535_2026 [Cyanobacteriota bacterium]
MRLRYNSYQSSILFDHVESDRTAKFTLFSDADRVTIEESIYTQILL